jgi:hypothetical protein
MSEEDYEYLYSSDEDISEEELLLREKIKEVENIYEYIFEIKEDEIFPLFDKLTIEELKEFLIGDEVLK